MVNVGVIEDDEVIQENLVRYFSGQPGYTCNVFASSVEEFLIRCKGNDLHVVLCDIGLPGQSGIGGIPAIRRLIPSCRVVMLTVLDDAETVFQALRAGASGYVVKQTPLAKVKEAIDTIHQGGGYMSPAIARKVIEHFNPSRLPEEALTSREIQVLDTIEEGLTNKEIAQRLDIGVETVKFHIRNIYIKLEIDSRIDIIKGKHRLRS